MDHRAEEYCCYQSCKIPVWLVIGLVSLTFKEQNVSVCGGMYVGVDFTS
jgi:hypothetical protein